MFRRKKKKTKINKQVIRQRRENRDIRHESSIRRFIREKKKEKNRCLVEYKREGRGEEEERGRVIPLFSFCSSPPPPSL